MLAPAVHRTPSMTDSPQRRPDMETVHRVLADPQRRRLLRYLGHEDGTATVTELAERLSGAEREGNASDRTRIRLHHVHLPMLAAAGVVDHDEDRVAITPRGRMMDEVSRIAEDHVDEGRAVVENGR